MAFSKNSPEWILSEAGREVAVRWMKDHGWYVLPADLIDRGTAPLLEHLNQAIISPDLLVAKNGISRWTDIKTKSHPTEYFKWNRLEHGINLNAWESYLRAEIETGIEGWLTVVEAERKLLMFARLRELAMHARMFPPRMHQSFPRGAVFFDEQDFRERYPFSDDLPAIEPISFRTQEQAPAPAQSSFNFRSEWR